jgi:adenosylcobinamide-phosphate synthase
MFEIQWYIILAAFILDFFLGDPAVLPHPVIYMGKAIELSERWFRKYIKHLIISGFLFSCFLILSTWILTFILIQLCINIHPLLGNLIEIILLFFCFSSTSLYKAAFNVFSSLEKKEIKKARQKLSMIVGRETQTLDKTAITQASIETVAENFVDGFLSPLFFALIGGVPMALAYKMINTLDSMVGYKNDTYIHFGRASAKIDDAANFIPARLSVLIITLSTSFFSFKRGVLALKTAFYQGSYHKSPNAGYPEAAFAGALKIKLGGPNYYHNILVEKPFIGKEFKSPDKNQIKHACDLMIFGSFLSVIISCSLLFLLG